LFLLGAASAAAEPVSLDPEFDPVTLAVGPSDDELSALVETPDGAVVLAGTVWGNDGRSSLAVVRLDEHGRRDRDFGDDGAVLLRPRGVSAGATSLHVDDDGSIVAAGYTFREDDSQTDLLLVRLLDDGQLDGGFGEGGVVQLDVGETSDGVNALVRAESGHLLVVGYRFRELGLEAVVVRLHADGALDTDFGEGGYYTLNVRDDLDELVAVAVDDDQRVVAVGRSHIGYSNFSEVLVVRLTPAGLLDPSFGEEGVRLIGLGPYGFDEGTSVVVDGGRIFVGATVEVGQLAGDLDLGVVALDDAGDRDESVLDRGATIFSLAGADGGGDREQLAALALGEDGSLVFAGRSGGDVVVGALDDEGHVADEALRLQPCSPYDRAATLAAAQGGLWLGLLCWQGFEHDFALARLVLPQVDAVDAPVADQTPVFVLDDEEPALEPSDEEGLVPTAASGCGCGAASSPADLGLLLALLLLGPALSSRTCRRWSR
jgi:uncharacterized delta-60 repeat protein